jgi:hypothetical protein
MGCYLGLRDLEAGGEHPDFHVDKIGNTRAFAALIGPCAFELRILRQGTGWGDPNDWVVRPTDFACWREAVSKFEFPDRELAMLDAMEANPNLWIEVSY